MSINIQCTMVLQEMHCHNAIRDIALGFGTEEGDACGWGDIAISLYIYKFSFHAHHHHDLDAVSLFGWSEQI